MVLLYVDLSFWLISFSLSLKNIFNISCKSNLTNSFNLSLSEKIYFSFTFGSVISMDADLKAGSFFFPHFKHFTPFSSYLHSFWKEAQSNSYPCFYVFHVFFPLLFLSHFLSLWFSPIWIYMSNYSSSLLPVVLPSMVPFTCCQPQSKSIYLPSDGLSEGQS